MKRNSVGLDPVLLRKVSELLERRAEADERQRRLNIDHAAAHDRLEAAKQERENVATKYRLQGPDAPSLAALESCRERVRQAEEACDGFAGAFAQLQIQDSKTRGTLTAVEASLCLDAQRATAQKAAEMLADLRAWNAKLLEPIAAIGAKAGNGQDLADFIASNVPNLAGIGNALAAAQSAKLPDLVIELAGGGRAPLQHPQAQERVQQVLDGLEGRAA